MQTICNIGSFKASRSGDDLAGVLGRVEIGKSSGYPLLDAAAVKAVKQSEFSVALADEIRVEAREADIYI